MYQKCECQDEAGNDLLLQLIFPSLFRKMKQDLKYLAKFARHHFRARSKYDIHSPYCYKLYSEVLKDKKDYPEYGVIKEKIRLAGAEIPLKFALLLFRITKYFRPANVLILSRPDDLITTCITLGSTKCRIVYSENISQIIQHIHNDSVLIMSNIYKSGETLNRWKQIQSKDQVTLSVDLFYLGLAFCRKELSREEFILRF
jgi:hypothetical protein